MSPPALIHNTASSAEPGMAIVDWHGRYVYANPTLAMYHGREIAEYNHGTFFELIPSPILSIVQPLYTHVLTTRLPVNGIDFCSRSVRDAREVIRWRANYWPVEQGVRVCVIALHSAPLERSSTPSMSLFSGTLPMKAQRLVNEHYSDPRFSLESASAALNVSEDHLGRLFKLHTGKSFRAYLREVRLSEAVHLLEHSDASIKAVAGLVGYSEASHFVRYFREATGCTPVEFKRQHRLASDLANNKSDLANSFPFTPCFPQPHTRSCEPITAKPTVDL